MEEELADYNGDNENEGENEAGKQAELAQNWGKQQNNHPILTLLFRVSR